MFVTGSQVADIFCNVCNTNLGWKYEMAFEEGQKYKVGCPRNCSVDPQPPTWRGRGNMQDTLCRSTKPHSLAAQG